MYFGEFGADAHQDSSGVDNDLYIPDLPNRGPNSRQVAWDTTPLPPELPDVPDELAVPVQSETTVVQHNEASTFPQLSVSSAI